jgi:flagellar hook assembly protein FlgD
MEFRLYQNDPNPFSAGTTIRFATPKACHVRLLLYNREHELVRVLRDGPAPAGQHTIVWDGTTANGERLTDGFYTYRLEANGFVAARKLEINSKL